MQHLCTSYDWNALLIKTWFRSEYHSNSTGVIRSHQLLLQNINNWCTITVWDDVISWHVGKTPCTCHQYNREYYSTAQNFIWHSFSIGYKNFCTCCSLTFWQLHKLSHIKVFHSSDTGRTRMQLAKVVIASALVLAACAEGLPDGKGNVFQICSYGCLLC